MSSHLMRREKERKSESWVTRIIVYDKYTNVNNNREIK